jgi:hypothetical protein
MVLFYHYLGSMKNKHWLPKFGWANRTDPRDIVPEGTHPIGQGFCPLKLKDMTQLVI